ncbi:GGDEF domain-containing protein [Phaeobacter sp. 11ANDIMAR09]|uniref:GGDEF domain-containing protein n=1 Tax=Phaeobacter sp. 11ANDIMAR09 TaxID=1225647 RepID=UPI0006C8D2C8|nr:diguanylate cyclase [Phaeobacter sp. 11ANDIMAR09]KPD12793.1 diguanylate cyclase [Phaeobacter sp. 11ANDIMAR09]
MRVVQLLESKVSTKVEGIHPESTLRQAAKVLLDLKLGALVVTDETSALVGIISERDLLPVVASCDPKAADALVSEVMTRSVISCSPEDEVTYLLHLMNENAIRHIPVLEKGKLVGILSIRELTKAYELLQIEANTDPLTQVSNRRPFLKTLETQFDRAQRRGLPMSVAMLDVDHFKRINDTYGHDAGDKTLQQLSRMLIREFRSIDLVGRLGGEEFALVFPDTDLIGAYAACERLRSTIQSSEIIADANRIRLTVSIGLTEICEEASVAAALLKRADELLYVAKNSGRNQVMTESGVVVSSMAKKSPTAAV